MATSAGLVYEPIALHVQMQPGQVGEQPPKDQHSLHAQVCALVRAQQDAALHFVPVATAVDYVHTAEKICSYQQLGH